jgi:trk system potassium uptake protein TrkH
MNYRMIAKFYSMILCIEAFFMIPSVLLSFHDGDEAVIRAFCTTEAVILLLAAVLALLSWRSGRSFFVKEGLFCVGTSWVLMSLVGCLPFFLSGEIPHYIDALFEIVSGFTTTGASILSDVESLSKASLYWRSFSHWLGGMGVLVFLLAIAPTGGQSGGFTMHLFRAESPGPDVGKLVPKLKQTAITLYATYIALTALNLVFLLLGDMPLFDALCTAFGTAGTGGFGVKNDSMGSYSPYIQNVTTVFMLLFGINFSCYYLLLLKQVRSVLRDEELRLYIGIVIAAVVLITVNLLGTYQSGWDDLRHSAFQVASIISTTGFSTVNFDLWPSFSKGILVALMVTGACAGSTCGGFKCARVLLMFKDIKRNIGKVLHPNRVEVVRVNGKPVDEKVMSNTNAYIAAYAAILFCSTLLISFDGHSLETNLTAVLACFNNIGPGLNAVGPACNYGFFSVFSKIILIVDMLAGRLEIFPIMVLFSKSLWSRK